jgi:hypothetical protein
VIALSWVTSFAGGARLRVRVQPRASRDEVTGIQGDCLRVKLTAPPVDGEANERLVKFLGRFFSCGKSRIRIIRGIAGRCKLLEITGVTEEEIRSRIICHCTTHNISK